MNPTSIANGVILAENDAILRGVMRAVLSRAEQLVFPASDGIEAVMLARRFTARLVLLDISMPRLNGLLACEAIRLLPGYGRVPIVLLSGSADEALRLAARRIGAKDVISKPFLPGALLSRLAPYLSLPSRGSPVPATVSGQALALTGHAEVWGPGAARASLAGVRQ
ncbi:MAG TPA: response regulator [Acetobacteraceae bacterium]|nr:response regulator [Acetobacteraceae bacterium]